LFVFIGIVAVSKKAWRKGIYLYFIAICLMGVLIVFLHLLKTWNIDNRFLAIVILPCFLFTCLGIQPILTFLNRRFGWRSSLSFSIVFFYILAFGLGKNLQERYADKTVFKEIGQFVSERENPSETISVVASFDFVRWFVFYSNFHQEGPEIPEIYDIRDIMNKKPEVFLRQVRKRRIKYLLVDERHWAKRSCDYFENYEKYKLLRLNDWHHKDTGKMVLFEVL
jgi:hypothetical protein